MEKVFESYNSTLESSSLQIEALKKKIHLIGTIRLLLVLAAIATIWFLWGHDWRLLVGIVLAYAIPFAVLMKYHNKLAFRKDHLESLCLLCTNELKGLNYDFSAFDGAPEMINGEHPFSLDLDIFGNCSFFQSVNRTVTAMGRERLINWFSQPLTEKEVILKRQEAVKELTPRIRLRQNFYVTGILHTGKSNDSNLLSRLTDRSAFFANSLFWRAAVWIAPLFWIIAFAALAMGHLSGALFGIFFLVSTVIAYMRGGKIGDLHTAVNKMEKILASYANLSECLEGEKFASEELSDISRKLKGKGTTASQAIRRLSAHIGSLDSRGTLSGMLLNIFTFRDTRTSIAIEQWNLAYGSKTGDWFDALAQFDSLSSLAGFAFNHPDYTYPTIADSYFTMSGIALGHPLIPRDVCVKNDISIGQNPWFLIITGANMAGKSTYLRTVGVNFLLATIGAPVYADKLTIYPAKLVTSLRTSDSLTSNESYFFAELKRLKMIIDRLKQGEKLFIILDEILKGTNSADKQKGSIALMKQLVTYNARGIIATHDLALGDLEKEFLDQIKNYRFESDVTNDALTFTYRLREGVAQNMNASYLMKKMGITL
ncbi:DNA mismatch repair protein MutS [Bacteroidia bacterium]|nr:DNA mismatch repair protein MutS [Bacteroidia bacterium]